MDAAIAAAAANEALQWACIGWLLHWAYKHNTDCHRGPGERLVSLETRMQAAEEESERLATNAHDDRDVISTATLDLAWMKRKLERL